MQPASVAAAGATLGLAVAATADTADQAGAAGHTAAGSAAAADAAVPGTTTDSSDLAARTLRDLVRALAGLRPGLDDRTQPPVQL